MAGAARLQAHLRNGLTQVCRCWDVVRRDGTRFGFTDHDRDLSFDGFVFRADEGLTARALEQTTGLAVDNTEALGVLSDAGIKEADILAGRFDGAEVRAWLVNWSDVEQRKLLFRGEIGEIERAGGGFKAELRGLTEKLNQPQGRVYQTPCAAVLGDGECRVDVTAPGYASERSVERVARGKFLEFDAFDGFEDRWFEQGRLVVLSGACQGDVRVIKNDRLTATRRRVELWEALRGGLAEGDLVRLEAGCDKRAETCRLKFDNLLNFRGFPHVPGEDWLMAYPTSAGQNDGGSLNS